MTVNVKACVVVPAGTVVVAVIVNCEVPTAALFATWIVAVPFPLSTKVTRLGSAPTVSAAGGVPTVVTVKDAPRLTLALLALVKAVVATTRVRVCVAWAPIPLVAVIMMG